MSTGSESSLPDESLVRLYRLQTRVVTSVFIEKALMITVLLFQVFSDDLFSNIGLFAIHIMITFLYCAINLAGLFILSFASFLLNPKYVGYGLMIILGGFLYWCLLTTIGFIPVSDIFLLVCIDQRCPESHWTVNMRWRNYGFKCPWDPLEKPKPTTAPGTVGKADLKAYYFNCQNGKVFYIVVSVLMALCYFIFMMYTLVRTYTFYGEIKTQLENIKAKKEDE